MRIISKFKDYYDYLKGVYGEDPKLILDRTDFFSLDTPTATSMCTLYIGDYQVDVIWIDGKAYSGKDIEPFDTPVKKRRFSWSWERYDDTSHYRVKYKVGNTFYTLYPLRAPLRLENSPTYKENCAILYSDKKDEYIKNPILREYDIQVTLPAYDVWLYLSEWLGRQITLNEKEVPIGDDKTRILSHGFDIKTSFRK